jgi:hypothetical protein
VAQAGDVSPEVLIKLAEAGLRFRRAERVSTFSERRLAWLVDHAKRCSEKVLTRSAPYIDSCALCSVFIKRSLVLCEKRCASLCEEYFFAF